MTEPTARLPTAEPGQPLARPLPGPLLAAAVLLLIGAALAGLLGGLMLLAGSIFDQMPAYFNGSGLSEEQVRASMDIARVALLVFGIGAMLVALAHLLAGVGVLWRRGWGRILGLVVSALGVLFLGVGLLASLVALAQPLPEAYLQNSGLTVDQYRSMVGLWQVVGSAIVAVGLAIYLFVLVVLARRGSEFA